jgi:adenine deaminase
MPQVTVDFPEECGQFVPQWAQEYFYLDVKVAGNEILITGDAAGLRNLAIQLLSLAENYVYPGCHVHLDSSNSIEDGPVQLVLQRK